MKAVSDPGVDGRVLRGTLNRQAIVDALLSLVAEQGALPTSQEIAERAGLAKRSVYHHFPDLEAVLVAAAETQLARYWHVLSVPPVGSVRERAEQAVNQRAVLFEQIGSVRRVAVLHEHQFPVVAHRLSYSRRLLRDHLRDSLQPEFSSLPRSAADGILAASSWESWEVLRNHQRLSLTASKQAVRSVIEAALEREPARKG